MVATVPSMIGQFNMNNIQILQELDYIVDVAADFSDTSIWPAERVQIFKDQIEKMGIECIQLNFSRSPFKLKRHFDSYKETMKLLRKRNYHFIHTHTPIASAVVRLAAHKTKTKVIYTAHGFHFYSGAPLKNWLIFYPIEKYLSMFTDILITINKEDYLRAKEKFHAKKVVYIPGVGVDIERFKPVKNCRKKIREELGLRDDQIMLLSVGELNENKNHEAVIKAIKGMKITYVIVGKGDLKERLYSVANEYNVDLRLMGFRNDVADFYDAADVYVLPSIREDLNVSLMEAMASRLPVACGNIRGNTDLIDDCLFSPLNIEEIKEAIKKAIDSREKLGERNLKTIQSFNLQTVEKSVYEIYRGGDKYLINLLKRQEKRTELGVPLDAKLLISVGELSVRKNHKVVVKALQMLPEDYWYVIVGKGDLKDELESADHTGRLKLLGYRTDIVDLLHSCDLFVFPSLQEGLPVALMEAMAAGIDVVVSKIRGNVDLVDKNLVNATDPEMWKIKIEEAVNSNSNEDYLANIQYFGIGRINKLMHEVYGSM